MVKQFISSGSKFESVAGYSRALVDAPFVFVSGTTGFDYDTMQISPDLEAQTEQCMKNIAKALGEAGASLDDVVRVTYYLTAKEQFGIIGPIVGHHFRAARPAASAVVVGLVDERMLIEIEVTARLPEGRAT
jgi:enamine deaminase RidA (YjgF/YER057c/UK114 family)